MLCPSRPRLVWLFCVLAMAGPWRVPTALGQLPPGALAPEHDGLQWFGRAAYNGEADEYVVVWAESGSIRAARLRSDGTRHTDAPDVIEIEGQGVSPDIAYNPLDDAYLVVWADGRLGSDDIRGRFLDGRATPLGASFEIHTAPGGHTSPRLAHGADDNRFLVVWNQIGAVGAAIQMRLVGGDPTATAPLIGPMVSLDADPARTLNPNSPNLAWNPASNVFLIAWTRVREVDGQDDALIRGAIRGGDGSALVELPVLADLPGGDSHPSVAANTETGEFLVAFNRRQGSDLDLMATLYDSSGSLVEAPLVVSATPDSPDWRPHAVFNSVTGRYLITFTRGRTCGVDPCDDILGRFVETDGTVGVEIPVATTDAVEVHGFDDGFASWYDMVASSRHTEALELYLRDGMVWGALVDTCPDAPLLSGGALAPATRGTPYAHTFEATCGEPPLVWAASGDLPSGLALDVSSGVLAGSPTAAGEYVFSVGVTDEGGAGSSATASFSLSVVGGGDEAAADAGPVDVGPGDVGAGEAGAGDAGLEETGDARADGSVASDAGAADVDDRRVDGDDGVGGLNPPSSDASAAGTRLESAGCGCASAPSSGRHSLWLGVWLTLFTRRRSRCI